jgi:hypothetical protein
MMHIISLGAGVQSTTMALMAAQGEITPMPDCAIFADTQSEPIKVYDHLRWLMSLNVLPFPVHIVTNGSLRDKVSRIRPKGKWAHQPIPAYLMGPNGAAPTNRDCTRDFKIVPIKRKVRELVGLTKKRAPKEPIVEQWIGISLDEAIRMKPSREAWIHHRFPLIEKRMSRGDCLEWLKRHDYPVPPKSACTFCPYHSNAMWRDMKLNDKASWQDAVELDNKLRNIWPAKELFLHRECKPLAEIDFQNAEDRGQLNMFNNDCEGMCGV